MSTTKYIDVENSSTLTVHDEAVYEVGKEMMKDSLKRGSDFCQFMTKTSIGAIPIYLGLLKFIFTDALKTVVFNPWMFFGPTLAFTVASILFAVGYYPKGRKVSLEYLNEITKAIEGTQTRRRFYSISGFVFFILGIVFGIYFMYTQLVLIPAPK